MPVLSGVPQGSILGPLLFLVYINDLPSVLETCQLLIFADDTKCFKQINSMSDTYLQQDDLNSLLRWSIDNHLHFNVSKFVFIRFHPKFNTEYNIDGFNIPCSSVCKDLSFIFSSDLSWNQHYKVIISKAYKSFDLLCRTFSETHCFQAKKWLYISLVRSTLLYCSSLWRPYQLHHIEALEKVQRRATKYILSDYTSNYKSRLIQLGILPLSYVSF